MKSFSTGMPWGVRLPGLLLCLLLGTLVILPAGPLAAEGSRTLYPEDIAGARANLEWRVSNYGDFVLRRTLLRVYAEAGEYLLLGSSAVDVPETPDEGDILVYTPGVVTGPIGNTTIDGDPAFSCREQRAETGNEAQGRINDRTEELAGPRTIADPGDATPGDTIPDGYIPCFYQVPETGIYAVVFYGPAGPGEDYEGTPNGEIELKEIPDEQGTSVAMWDVTVRASLTSTNDIQGRLFTYYLTLFTGENDRPLWSVVYVVSSDGYIYEIDLRGMDPNGFVLFANRQGFLDSDGKRLYRDVLAKPGMSFQAQNQLMELQGNTNLAGPDFPIFFNRPATATLQALDIPLEPEPPQVSNFQFIGTDDNVTRVGAGGTFRFTSNVDGTYQLVISRNGTNFDPTNPRNAVLRGFVTEGVNTVAWDGLADNGDPLPIGQGYIARVTINGGEIHFPMLDVENNIYGGPILQLLNPPGGNCPLWEGGCFGAFYDDRGYRTADDTLVGVEVNGLLCPNSAGDPPEVRSSNPLTGFDTRTRQRAYGFAVGGNPPDICQPEGGFGDKKGLDIWTYYPSEIGLARLNITGPTAIALESFTATIQASAISLRWETSAELDTWGFHLLRSADGTRADATRITPELIPAQGRGQGGAVYTWRDTQVQADTTYTYWLEEIELNESTNEYGPATAAYETGAAGRKIFLPLVIR